jgi:hypothetical protein
MQPLDSVMELEVASTQQRGRRKPLEIGGVKW